MAIVPLNITLEDKLIEKPNNSKAGVVERALSAT
jgi:hypothetical protein